MLWQRNSKSKEAPKNQPQQQQEERALLQKLRDKYQKAAQKYGSALFNMGELEKRIDLFRTNRGNIGNFLTDEMIFFEKNKEAAQEKQEFRGKQLRGETHLSQMIARQEAKIKKYPDNFFSPHATLEMRHFVGAISQFHRDFFGGSKYILHSQPIWQEVSALFADLERFCSFTEGDKAMMLKHYEEEMQSASKSAQREETDRQYFQTAGSSLYKIHLKVRELALETSSIQNDTPLNSDFPNRLWRGKSQGEFMSELFAQAKQVLDDFRVTSLVAYHLKKG